ncbi:putative oxidoreductase C736.13-like protein 8 [Colletotrichum chlorophyti]|uniref:Putative oxidoreductase C736.13-like protein 8 n=1 Tax=Colletotrichum chlorophyti TaxID=708187 RepID=A0A1Q8RML9_9PEZI|nr:putative oxidoreductase C736.13-like protein 8 [Colletotrichum chlorophyti]
MSGIWNPLTDMPNVEGKVVVVTGGTAGIGTSTVKYLALRGAKVYFTARSRSKAENTIDSLTSEFPQIGREQLDWLPVDLANLQTVRAGLAELKARETMVDILINNAGIASSTTEKAGPGWEWHMAVNHVGHFVFTNGILPLLKKAANQEGSDVRIVTLSSNVNYAMLPQNFEFTFESTSFLTTPVPYYPWQWRYLVRHIFYVDMIRYAVSKLANLLFAQELQRLMDEQGLPILSISVHPGGVDSEGCKDIGNAVFSLVRSTFLTPDQGAITTLFAATAEKVRQNPETFKGKYLEPYGKVVTPHPVSKNQKQVKGMWDNTTLEVNKHLAKAGLEPLQNW